VTSSIIYNIPPFFFFFFFVIVFLGEHEADGEKFVKLLCIILFQVCASSERKRGRKRRKRKLFFPFILKRDIYIYLSHILDLESGKNTH